jgi:DNA-binding Lrp family transcriptional regulator
VRGYVAQLDAGKLGFTVTAFVSVTIANGPYKQPHRFQQAIAGIAEIQECHTVTWRGRLPAESGRPRPEGVFRAS